MLQEVPTIGAGTVALVTGALLGALELAKMSLRLVADTLKARRNGHTHQRSTDTKTTPMLRGEALALFRDVQGETERIDGEIHGLREWRNAREDAVVARVHGLEIKMLAEFGLLKERLAKAGL